VATACPKVVRPWSQWPYTWSCPWYHRTFDNDGHKPWQPWTMTMMATKHDNQLGEIYPTMLNELNCTFAVSFSRFHCCGRHGHRLWPSWFVAIMAQAHFIVKMLVLTSVNGDDVKSRLDLLLQCQWPATGTLQCLFHQMITVDCHHRGTGHWSHDCCDRQTRDLPPNQHTHTDKQLITSSIQRYSTFFHWYHASKHWYSVLSTTLGTFTPHFYQHPLVTDCKHVPLVRSFNVGTVLHLTVT